MSTEQTLQIESKSAEETLQIAANLGVKLRGGEVIELVSDLGGGKTTFVKGLAAGMGVKDMVSSPSFTISNEYNAKNLILHHFDFYRLNEPGILSDELREFCGDPNKVVVVEWANIVEDVLPEQHIRLIIKPLSEDGRRIVFLYPKTFEYLFENNT